MKLSLPWRRTRPEGKLAPANVPQTTKAAYGMSGFTLHSPGQARWSVQNYAALAREGYTKNPIVFRAIRLVAETASAVPWLLYEGRDERSEHPLLDLIKKPNDAEAGATFFEALFGYLLISGNAFIQLNFGSSMLPTLHLLRPDRMTVI
jgi:phage portal protein BeeE